MSEIIGYIISYVVAYLLALAISLLVVWLIFRKTEKHVHDSIRELRENRAALEKSHNESRAQIGKFDESAGEIHESSDEKDEYLEGLIEFTRIMRDYSDYKTKMIEARENFCESQFSDEKNIH